MREGMRDLLVLLGAALVLTIFFGLVSWNTHKWSIDECVGLLKIDGETLDQDRPFIKRLHRMLDDSRVKAIVVDINSPGGSMAVAQSIQHEILKARQRNIVVVAAMGDVCASGGYFIACGADRIFASPASITGSIGVILRYPEAEQLMQKIGIRMEVIQSGEYKNIGDFSKKLTPREREIFQQVANDLHLQFKEMIFDRRGNGIARALAESRKMQLTDVTPDMVHAEIARLADGRIFSGRQALANGLIDDLGNLDDAVAEAGRLAKIKGAPEVLQEKEPMWWEEYLNTKESDAGVMGKVLMPGIKWLLARCLTQ